MQPAPLDLRDKVLIQLTSPLRTGGCIKGGPPAATDVAVEGELGNGEHRPAHIVDAQIHPAVVILKDAQSRNLLGEIVCVGGGVARRNAEQHQQPRPNLANSSSVDCDGSCRDALYNGAHSSSTVASGFPSVPKYKVALPGFGDAKIESIRAEGGNSVRLKDKAAVITGAANGIGRAIALRFAREGASVVINDIDKGAGQALESEILQNGGTSLYLHGDAASERDVLALMTAVRDRFGALDILVNNVVADADAVSTNQWDSLVEVCLKSYWITMKAAFPLMHAGSNVVNVSSVNALMGFGKEHVYSSMKAAILGLSRSMVGEFSPHGIRINCICPGTVVTERWRTRFAQNPELEERLTKLYPIGRLGIPEDVANAALFLASDEASFITGVVLTVDGGLTAVNTAFIK